MQRIHNHRVSHRAGLPYAGLHSGWCWPLRPVAVAVLIALGLAAAGPAGAQSLPDAGRLLNDVTPLPSLPAPHNEVLPPVAPLEPAAVPSSDVRFAVTAFDIHGVTAFDSALLAQQLDDLRGTQRQLDTLQEAVTRITRFYRQHGYLLARAYLPQQNIESGQIEIDVLEGRLGRIGLHNSADISSDVVRRRLERIGIDQALQSATLESTLLLLSDLPGIVVRSALAPGATVGATDLEVQITPARKVDADVSLDNYGNRYTGQYHASANVAVNNPFGIGDQLAANVISSGREFNYGRVAYQFPLNDAGTRMGLSYTAMTYQLGQDFADLDAYGVARISGLNLSHPLIRSRGFNLNLQARFEHKELHDLIALEQQSSAKRLNNLSLGVSGDATQGSGGIVNAQQQGSLFLTLGELRMDAANAASDAEGHRTQGGFIKANGQWLRLQRLNDADSVLLQLSGQISSGNLDSVEKMSLGGPYAVRAYPSGEAPADEALMLNLEYRHTLDQQWQAMLFGDMARGRLNHSPIAADGSNLRTLSGLGVGARWSHPDGYRLQATLAWRTDSAPVSDHDRLPRFWLQMSKVF